MVIEFSLKDGSVAKFNIRKKDVSRAGNTELHYRYTVEIKARHKCVTIPYHDFSTAFYYGGILNKRGATKCIIKTLGQPQVKEVLTKEDVMRIKVELTTEEHNG